MTKLVRIPSKSLPDIIDLVYPRIEAATQYSVGKYTGSDVIKKIVDCSMQLWVAFDEDGEKVDGLAITEISVYPKRRILKFLCATGENMDGWAHHIKTIEEWSRVEMHCDGSQAECRPGWEKILKGDGYVKTHVILNKDF